jgi:hypothetical protein
MCIRIYALTFEHMSVVLYIDSQKSRRKHATNEIQLRDLHHLEALC